MDNFIKGVSVSAYIIVHGVTILFACWLFEMPAKLGFFVSAVGYSAALVSTAIEKTLDGESYEQSENNENRNG